MVQVKLRHIWLGLAALAACLSPPGDARAQTFGPDAFGYSLTRTNNPATYTTIKGVAGTILLTPFGAPADPPGSLIDDQFFQAPIGFSFPFYGVNQTDAFVHSNGFIAFGGVTNTNPALGTQVDFSYTNPNFNSASIVGGTGPQVDRHIVAPWWDDLQFTAGQAGGLYTLSRTVGGVQEFVVEWNNDAFFNAVNSPVTFQATLRSNGTMQFLYPDVTTSFAGGTNGASATVGIHDLGGGTGNNRFLQFSFNTVGALNNGDVINFTITPVPEPSALLLCGAAVAGAWVVRRRRAGK